MSEPLYVPLEALEERMAKCDELIHHLKAERHLYEELAALAVSVNGAAPVVPESSEKSGTAPAAKKPPLKPKPEPGLIPPPEWLSLSTYQQEKLLEMARTGPTSIHHKSRRPLEDLRLIVFSSMDDRAQLSDQGWELVKRSGEYNRV